jgi:hypothetical protein
VTSHRGQFGVKTAPANGRKVQLIARKYRSVSADFRIIDSKLSSWIQTDPAYRKVYWRADRFRLATMFSSTRARFCSKFRAQNHDRAAAAQVPVQINRGSLQETLNSLR